jgi:hypothetical protein
VVAYRVKGARSTAIQLRVGGWKGVFEAMATEALRPHGEAAGHLLEHVMATTLAEPQVPGLVFSGSWMGRSAEWSAEGAPGDARRMLSRLGELLRAGPPLEPGVVEAEWSRVRLEAQHRRKQGSWYNVHDMLSGEPRTPEAPAELDPRSWAGGLQAIREVWLRPERAVLVVAGPHRPEQGLQLAREALARLPKAEPEPEPEDPGSPPPEPRRIRRQYNGPDPVPTVYAWVVPHLHAYRGAHSVFAQIAHEDLLRRSARAGLAYVQGVGPAAHHIWGAVWCSPSRVQETLTMLRGVFLDSLQALSDPDVLGTARRSRARVAMMDYTATPRAVASSYFWVRRMFREVPDPFTVYLREIATASADDVRRLQEQYGGEALVTAVEYCAKA